jgi:hypothetical protein
MLASPPDPHTPPGAIRSTWSNLLAIFEQAGLGQATVDADGDTIYVCFDGKHWPDITWAIADYRDFDGRLMPSFLEVRCGSQPMTSLDALRAQLAGLAQERRELAVSRAFEAMVQAAERRAVAR